MSAPDFSKYPAAQRAAYLGAIASLLTADQQASQAEAEFLSHLAQATGLSQQDAQHVVDAALDPNNGTLKRDLTTLKGSDLRFSLIQDLIAFAQSDGQYTDAEQERIGQMAQFLGVTEEQFDALHQYQQAAADGQNVNDPRFLQQSGIGSLFSQLGLPKGGGMLSGILAVAGPMILQKVMSGSRGSSMGAAAGSPGGGGGLMDILGQVMGGMGGGGAPQQGQASSGGGLMDILGQVMGGMGGGQPQSQSGMSSGMGGLGQILQVLGQMGGQGGGAPQQQAAVSSGRGGYDATGGLIGELFPKH